MVPVVITLAAVGLAVAIADGTLLDDGGPVRTSDSAQTSTPDAEPRSIAGGSFEASGVVHVPRTDQLLFVDDGRNRELFSMELTSDGRQVGSAVPVAIAADITDLEGITSDGERFYVVGSQSKNTGFDGDGLVRFSFDAATRRTSRVERIGGLKAWLAANVAELRGTERRVGDHVLNIEGLAWDPVGRRLLLGLRAPVVNDSALVIAVTLADSAGPFSLENLRVDGAVMRLGLGGAGIRSLEYDARSRTFHVISGAGLNDESRDFRLLEWDGTAGSVVREIRSYDRRLKPEGITRATIAGQSVSVLVFDVGSFEMIR
jgi:hypothetical protein